MSCSRGDVVCYRGIFSLFRAAQMASQFVAVRTTTILSRKGHITLDTKPVDPRKYIIVRGARQHNLKNIDLDIPKGALIVVTGPSGSGKSSLAFSTIYAEGHRRYVESLSSYARQFLERMDKPDVDRLAGLAPAIAIDQKTVTRNPRSTVATQTELHAYMRMLFAQIGRTISPISGEEVVQDTPPSVARTLEAVFEDGQRYCVAFPAIHADIGDLRERGYTRSIDADTGQITEMDETFRTEGPCSVVVDRLVLRRNNDSARTRMIDAIELAFREGEGLCCVVRAEGGMLTFSRRFERDGMEFEKPHPRMFSFTSPVGACGACQGKGTRKEADPARIIPNHDVSLKKHAVQLFHHKGFRHYYEHLLYEASRMGIDTAAPFNKLTAQQTKMVWEGRGRYPGINSAIKSLESAQWPDPKATVQSRYRAILPCSVCRGSRLRTDALYVRVGGRNLGEVMNMTIREAAAFFEELVLTPFERDAARTLFKEIRRRLRILLNVGLDYLTLGRASNTLSGGESQRMNLASALGSSLVGSLYVLDEPTVGLHSRDTHNLIDVLERLRAIGNTVMVVEHDPEVMRRADYIIDLGPGAGTNGGNVVFHGPYPDILDDAMSLTGDYLAGRREVPMPVQRRKPRWANALELRGARRNNLKNIDVRFPLGLLCCVTGVSGSGKSTLVLETLCTALKHRIDLDSPGPADSDMDDLVGTQLIAGVVVMDQNPIGRSPRSNPATYTKVFDYVRQILASTDKAQLRGCDPGYFSFNVQGGRCESCEGEGVVKVDMQFLADLYLECEDCNGKRYTKDVLEIRYKGKNVDDILNLTVDEAAEFFADKRAIKSRLGSLQEIGLGYLKLGQPATTLSGGEAQRIRLATELGHRTAQGMLYLFDEPTTGLHPDDIRKLVLALNRLVDEGHSVVVVEHNIDVIKCADWVLDLGPGPAADGGRIVVEGPPETIAQDSKSHTGHFLLPALSK